MSSITERRLLFSLALGTGLFLIECVGKPSTYTFDSSSSNFPDPLTTMERRRSFVTCPIGITDMPLPLPSGYSHRHQSYGYPPLTESNWAAQILINHTRKSITLLPLFWTSCLQRQYGK